MPVSSMAPSSQEPVATYSLPQRSKALFLVETPFQLICAYEMIAAYQLDYDLVLRLTSVGRSDEQLRQTALNLNLQFKEITIRVGKHYSDTLMAPHKLAAILLPRYENVFLGSYFSRFLMTLKRFLRSDQFWLLDDGVATFLAQTEMSNRPEAPYNLATFFKVPALPGQTVIYHDLQHLAALNDIEYSDESLFIGQPPKNFESNSNYQAVIPDDSYNYIIDKCRKNSPSAMIYVPHRLERPDYVEQLRKKFDLDVLVTSTCIELHFVRRGKIPRTVYTPISTAGFAFASMFPESQISIFPLTLINVIPHARELLEYAKGTPNMSVADELADV